MVAIYGGDIELFKRKESLRGRRAMGTQTQPTNQALLHNFQVHWKLLSNSTK
jgi:hypothetical protein